MMSRFCKAALAALIITALCAAPVAAADDAAAGPITFTKDILPILQENCQTCHHPATSGFAGMVAPMPLVTYEEVRPWVKSIAKVVVSREMPPWSASVEERGHFDNERYLTEEQIQTIVTWANTGVRRGDASDAPDPLTFSDQEWWLGEPDMVIELPERVWVGDDVEDWQPMYQVPLTEIELPEDRWVRAMESVGDADCVHHMVVYAAGPGMGRDRGPTGVGGNIGGLAPGAEPYMAKDGTGILLKKGTTLAVSMHYHKESGPGTGEWDRSKIGFYFYPADAKVRNVQIAPIGNMNFEIPAHNPDWEVGSAHTFDRPIKLLGMLPHMHFRGSAAKYEAFYPDGTSETLLDVPVYDYAWQHTYRFKEPRQMPVGTRVEVTMHFDNSANNPANPDPSKNVRFGGPTTDEMALGWMYYTYEDEAETVASAYEPIITGGRD